MTLHIKSETPMVKALALHDQPADRVSTNPAACNTMELLAAIIGGPQQIELAGSLLSHFDGDIHRMFSAYPEQLCKVRGIGKQTAARIKASLALGMMFNRPAAEMPHVNSPADAYSLLREMEMFDQEHLRVILLDSRLRCVGVTEVYVGAVNKAQVRLSEVFRPAIQRNVPMIILAHNHPSNDPTPSPEDVAVTRAAIQVGNLMEIAIQDHIVIGRGGCYTSLKERGLAFA
jgi:DNA repair protein RadC